MFYLLFELYFLIHLAPLMYHLLPLFISSFLSFLPLDTFIYSLQKGRKNTREYTGVYCHFYMTPVHILVGRNSTLCTFVEGESYRGDAYTKGEKTCFMRKPCCLVLPYACFLVALWCCELLLVSMFYCSHRIVFMCWTCIHFYAIVLYWLHVRMIICFAIWSL